MTAPHTMTAEERAREFVTVGFRDLGVPLEPYIKIFAELICRAELDDERKRNVAALGEFLILDREVKHQELQRYLPDIVKNAMLVAWQEICADTGRHPLDIDEKYLTFEPRHWAQMAGDIVTSQVKRFLD